MLAQGTAIALGSGPHFRILQVPDWARSAGIGDDLQRRHIGLAQHQLHALQGGAPRLLWIQLRFRSLLRNGSPLSQCPPTTPPPLPRTHKSLVRALHVLLQADAMLKEAIANSRT